MKEKLFFMLGGRVSYYYSFVSDIIPVSKGELQPWRDSY